MQMYEQAKYHEMLFISDTCQAASLYGSIKAPHVLSMASSKIGKGCFVSCMMLRCLPITGTTLYADLLQQLPTRRDYLRELLSITLKQ